MKLSIIFLLCALVGMCALNLHAIREEESDGHSKYRDCWEDFEVFMFQESFKEQDMRIGILKLAREMRRLEREYFPERKVQRRQDIIDALEERREER